MPGVQYSNLSSVNQAFISNIPQAQTVQSGENKNTKGESNKPSLLRAFGGGFLGWIACDMTMKLSRINICTPCGRKMQNIAQSVSKEEMPQINKAITSAIKNAGLDKKGVEIIEVNARNIDSIEKIARKNMPKMMPDFIVKPQIEQIKAYLLNGINAYFTMKTNQILVPENNKLALTTFHEIGHAINKNIGKLGKVLQKAREFQILFLPVLLIAICKNKKQEDEKPKNKLDSATDFIKNHAGKIAFAFALPKVAEEALASYRGNKLAKQLLSPELAKKVKTANRYGLATYATLAAAIGIGTYLAKTLRDMVVHKTGKQQAN